MTHNIYSQTNFKAIEQLKLVRGENIYVYDDQGNKYIEGLSGLWCSGLGYGNEEVANTAAEVMKTVGFTHTFGGKTHPWVQELSEKLASLLPMDDARVYLGLSGSDANDTQIKLLRYYFDAIGKPEKRKIISRERSYHGITMAATAVTGLPVSQAHFHPPEEALGILRTHAPHYYRGKQGAETEEQFVERILGDLEAQILREDPETIAAFIAEPITGASGVIVPPPSYYPKLQAILQKYDIFFWSDEVINGFGRTGEIFGCQGFEGIERPDMMVMAKQLTAAYSPLSCAAIRGDMHEAMYDQSATNGVFGHGYTYTAHPVSCAVSSKVLEIYEREGIYANAARQGEYMQKRLAEFKDHPLVGEVRGKGLIGAVELVANKETGAEIADGKGGLKCLKNAQDAGLILRAVAGNSMAFCPPMIIKETQLDDMIGKFSDALDKTYKDLQAEGLVETLDTAEA